LLSSSSASDLASAVPPRTSTVTASRLAAGPASRKVGRC
jgi:hypothetical protein